MTGPNGSAPSRAPETPWLLELHTNLLAEARRDVNTCCKVAVLLAAKVPRSEIARQLEIEPRDVDAAVRRLRVVSEAPTA